MAEAARKRGTGVASAEFLPGTRLVRAFNAINAGDLSGEAHRKGEPVAIELRKARASPRSELTHRAEDARRASPDGNG
jgi:hypothetical protein